MKPNDRTSYVMVLSGRERETRAFSDMLLKIQYHVIFMGYNIMYECVYIHIHVTVHTHIFRGGYGTYPPNLKK